MSTNGIPVLTSKGQEWFEARLFIDLQRLQKTEDSYVMSIDGNPPAKYPIHLTEVMDNITPNAADIKELDIVLCKIEQKWMEAVVIEMYDGDTTTAMDNLYRLHAQNGAELVSDARGVRVISSNKSSILATADTLFMLMDGFKDLVNSSSSDEGANNPPAPQNSTSNVSKEQLEHTIEQLFHHADNSGELSYEEVQELSSSMGLFLNKGAWAKIFKQMDTDGNGSISKEELINFWEQWYMDKGPGAKLKKSRNSTLRKSAKF